MKQLNELTNILKQLYNLSGILLGLVKTRNIDLINNDVYQLYSLIDKEIKIIK